uniref:Uncharacterized protein n=1 Tax=Vespula pensylvanica TaxID=30213 RepID=A0A834NXF8_VESPE|nr:hypothetical protein H0235_010494 [Vespula pensylvanica]
MSIPGYIVETVPRSILLPLHRRAFTPYTSPAAPPSAEPPQAQLLPFSSSFVSVVKRCGENVRTIIQIERPFVRRSHK